MIDAAVIALRMSRSSRQNQVRLFIGKTPAQNAVFATINATRGVSPAAADRRLFQCERLPTPD
jgi:hypothetical protein